MKMSPSSYVLGLWVVLVLFLLCQQKVHCQQEYCPEDANVDDPCENNGVGTCQEANGNSRLRCVLSQRPGRIVNGEDTTTDQHVHQVTLQLLYFGSWYHICGGNVIDGRWVLTAAHCVYWFQMEDLRVVVDQDDTYQVYSLDRIEMFPGYVYAFTPIGFHPYDIALLKTSVPIIKAGHYKIDLAPAGETFVGVNCTITGWGVTRANGAPTDVLKITHGIILSNEECSSLWFDLGMYNGTHNICIHNEDTSACFGDSGGPMVCDGVLAGVSSWVHYQCNTTFPSVYTRVSNFLDWINRVVKFD